MAAAIASTASQTVAMTLQGYKNSVNEFIQTEISQINGPNNLYLTDANRLLIAIGNEEYNFSYRNVSGQPIDKVNALFQYQMSVLQAMVSYLQSKQSAEVEAIPSCLAELAGSFCLGDWQPQLFGVHPHYAKVANGGFEVFFIGNFPQFSRDSGCTLSLPNATCVKAQGASKNRVTFQIQSSVVSKPTCQFFRAVLNIQYDAGTWITNLKTKSYDILIGIAAASPSSC